VCRWRSVAAPGPSMKHHFTHLPSYKVILSI
jgi:hypothetical protein